MVDNGCLLHSSVVAKTGGQKWGTSVHLSGGDKWGTTHLSCGQKWGTTAHLSDGQSGAPPYISLMTIREI